MNELLEMALHPLLGSPRREMVRPVYAVEAERVGHGAHFAVHPAKSVKIAVRIDAELLFGNRKDPFEERARPRVSGSGRRVTGERPFSDGFFAEIACSQGSLRLDASVQSAVNVSISRRNQCTFTTPGVNSSIAVSTVVGSSTSSASRKITTSPERRQIPH